MKHNKKRKQKYEYEFLPAALEIEETPSSPLGQAVIWIIFIMIIIAVIWSVFAKTDKIAIAQGKIIPLGKEKLIQTFEEGIIKKIYVEEGEKIKKNQILISFDTTLAQSVVDETNKTIETLNLEKSLLRLTLASNSEKLNITSNSLYFKEYPLIPESEIEYHIELKKSAYLGFQDKISTQELVLIQSNSDLNIAETVFLKLKAKLAVIFDQEKIYRKLSQSGSISKQNWIEKQSDYDSLEHEIKAQEIDIKRITHKIKEGERTLELIKEEWKTQNLKELVETEKRISQAVSEFKRAAKRLSLQGIFSPVDGTVNQLEVTTVGQVVAPAQTLMTIIPESMPLAAEVSLNNMDVGFVSKGDKAELKFDTFPFQKYGIISGTVENVSPDAVVNEKTGELIYEVKIKPDSEKIKIDGRYVSILPGMTLTAEIKTGERRVIDYFLDPVIKFKSEAFKQR